MKKFFLYTVLTFLIFIKVTAYDKIIVIDPGHNYDDIADGYRTETEVLTNWDVANKLKDQIDSYYNSAFNLDWNVILTRDNNDAGSNVSISDRELIANTWEVAYPGKVYFLSIHCNASEISLSNGTETFYCNESFSNTNLLVRYGNAIHNNLIEHGEFNNRRMVECGDYNGTGDCLGKDGLLHLCVLDDLTMPNLLSEIAFVTNDADEEKLLDDTWRSKFAQAYFEGFRETFTDLNVISVNFEQIPNLSTNPNGICKINVIIKNVGIDLWTGDVRAILRDFPMYSYESPTSQFCELGSSKSALVLAGEQIKLTFQGQIPMTIDLGKALHIESKEYNSNDWKTVPTTNHRNIIKVPLNGALIEGAVFNKDNNPLHGAVVKSYEYIDQKSDVLDFFFDPKSVRTNINGEFELIAPCSWEQCVVSIPNHNEYDNIILPTTDHQSIVFRVPYDISYYWNSPKPCDTELNKLGFYINDNLDDDVVNVCLSNGIIIKAVNPHEGTCSKGKFKLRYKHEEDFYWDGCNHDPDPIECFNLVFKCHCYYWLIYISIIEVDNSLNSIGEEIGEWVNVSPVVIGDYQHDILESFNLLEYLPSGANLTTGKKYKLKIASSGDYWGNGWEEHSRYISVSSYESIISGASITENIFSEYIEIDNSSISNQSEIIAGQSIIIKPNTSIASGLFAINDFVSCSAPTNKSISNDYNKYLNPNTMNNETRSIDVTTIEATDIALLDTATIYSFNNNIENYCLKGIINEKAEKNIPTFNIYPNPGTGIYTIDISGYSEQIEEVAVYDQTGKILYHNSLPQERVFTINLTVLSHGIYFAKVITQSHILTKSIIKE